MTPYIETNQCPEYYFEERCFIRELLNDPKEAGLSIAQARVTPGITTVLHSLNGTEVYYILKGEGLVSVDDFQKTVKPGDVVYISAGQKQRIQNTSDADDLLFLAICSPRFVPEDYTSLEDR